MTEALLDGGLLLLDDISIGCADVLLLGVGETLVDFVPVDDVPPGGEVVGAAVVVLEVVGVLPNVVADDGVEAVGKG
jgi:hypothetical protein